MALHGFLRLQAVAGDAEHGAFVARDSPDCDELSGAGDGHAAGGLGKNAFAFGEQADAFDDFVIGDVLGEAAGFFHRVNRVVAIGRRADGEGLHDRVGLRHRLDDIGAALHRVADRRAAAWPARRGR